MNVNVVRVICYICQHKFDFVYSDVRLYRATCLTLYIWFGRERYTMLAVYGSPLEEGDMCRFVSDLDRYFEHGHHDRH